MYVRTRTYTLYTRRKKKKRKRKIEIIEKNWDKSISIQTVK